MHDSCSIDFELNGVPVAVTAPVNHVLCDVLREVFGLDSIKIACDQSVCGACTVLVDGFPVASCQTLVFEADGRSVATIEGLKRGSGELHVIQQAFVEAAALQCGFCTPGMIMLVKSLLDHSPRPSRDEIVQWLSANVCRCTGYQMIIEAVEIAAARMTPSERGR